MNSRIGGVRDTGWLDGREHVYAVRVYFEDTDAAGIVYYANYFKFAERARTEWMRRIGFEHSEMMRRDGIAFAVRRVGGDYRRPARLDDVLDIRTRLLAVGGATMSVEQVISRDGEVLVHLSLDLALIHVATGRPARIPAGLRAHLAGILSEERQV